jgi:hypothetical protein
VNPRYLGSAAAFGVGLVVLASLPFLLGTHLATADSADVTVFGVVITAVAALTGVVAAWWRYWIDRLRWIRAGRDVTAATARIVDLDGHSAGTAVAIGRGRLLATRDAVSRACSAGADGVTLEFRVRGIPQERTARRDVDLPRRPDGSPRLTVLRLAEPLPSGVPVLRVGRLDPSPADSTDIALVHLGPERDDGPTVQRGTLVNNRVTGISVTGTVPGTGGFVVRPSRSHVVGVLRDDAAGTTVADPVAVGLQLPGPPARGRSWRTGLTASALSLVLACLGWAVWRPHEIRLAGWEDYVDDPAVQGVLRRHGLAVSAVHSSGGSVPQRAADGSFEVFTASNIATKDLLLRDLQRHGPTPIGAPMVDEPMVVATYLPVLDALAAGSDQLAVRGADGVLRFSARRLVLSLDAQRKGTGDRSQLLRWGDIPGFPTRYWPATDPVNIVVPSPCGAGAGMVFVQMALGELRPTVKDPGELSARTREVLNAVYTREETRQETREIARAWAKGMTTSPFTLLYENRALTSLAENPREPGTGRRVLLYLEDPVVVTQFAVARDTPAGRTALELLTGDSPDAVRIREIQAGRLGLRFSEESAKQARRRFIDRYGLAPALAAGRGGGGGEEAEDTLRPSVPLPGVDQTLPYLRTLCPGQFTSPGTRES